MRRGGAKRVLRKEGEVPAPPASPSLEIPKKPIGGQKIKGGVIKSVNEK
jgi:hypothetical protein